MVEDGRVAVNGERVATPALVVGPDDKLLVDGKALTFYGAQSTQVYVANKLAGELVTTDDPRGRPTLAGRLKQGRGLKGLIDRLKFVGRLDFNSEGLILLTNSASLATRLEHPSIGLERRYRVRVHGTVPDWKLAAFGRGVTVDGVRYKPMKATLEPNSRREGGRKAAASGRDRRDGRGGGHGGDGPGPGKVKSAQNRRNAKHRKEGPGGSNSWLRITCTEGKNRQVRRVCKHFGLDVNRLIRVGFGPFDLTGCDKGGLLKVDPKKALRALELADDQAAAVASSASPSARGGGGGGAAAGKDTSGLEFGILGLDATAAVGDSDGAAVDGGGAGTEAPRRGRRPLTAAGARAAK